jgi:hypothetical protein
VERQLTALVLVFATISGCDRSADVREGDPQRERSVERVIARVGDEVIGATDVAERMRASGLGPNEALDELIDEALLVDEATKRGLTESDADQRAVERVMVRRMLKDFEAELTPADVREKDVRADFEQHREKFQVPERRASWHVLVRDSSDAARALSESILRDVRSADDPKTVYERYASGEVETEVEVIAEELPPITREAGFEEPFKDALFAAKATGPLESAVETKYGWHVIVLTDIVPGEVRELEDVEDDIRERLSQKMRFRRVAATVAELEGEGLVEYDEDGVDRLLSTAGLPKRAE